MLIIRPRWRSWIAQPPPKGQVAGSNPARGTIEINKLSEPTKSTPVTKSAIEVQLNCVLMCFYIPPTMYLSNSKIH